MSEEFFAAAHHAPSSPPFSPLARLVRKFGEGNWSPIARALNETFEKSEDQGRIGKQCREVRRELAVRAGARFSGEGAAAPAP